MITAQWIETVIKDFVRLSSENTLRYRDDEKAWDTPLVGISRGDDPLYGSYKEHVGHFHWTPKEIFTLTFPDVQVTPDRLVIISWILPQMPRVREDNGLERIYPAERWARSRIFGEITNVKLREHVVAVLQSQGYHAVAPQLSPLWKTQNSAIYGRASTWSERHAAYAAGLGTFGLCDGLITARGKAMRTGSVVADVVIPPTPRPYENHHAYCLFFAEGTCKKCITRCPVGAITEQGHDKDICYNHTVITSREYIKSNYHLEGYCCGLCQTNVPCENVNPVIESKK